MICLCSEFDSDTSTMNKDACKKPSSVIKVNIEGISKSKNPFTLSMQI